VLVWARFGTFVPGDQEDESPKKSYFWYGGLDVPETHWISLLHSVDTR
jgi:hypothetical protein